MGSDPGLLHSNHSLLHSRFIPGSPKGNPRSRVAQSTARPGHSFFASSADQNIPPAPKILRTRKALPRIFIDKQQRQCRASAATSRVARQRKGWIARLLSQEHGDNQPRSSSNATPRLDLHHVAAAQRSDHASLGSATSHLKRVEVGRPDKWGKADTVCPDITCLYP